MNMNPQYSQSNFCFPSVMYRYFMSHFMYIASNFDSSTKGLVTLKGKNHDLQ